MRFLLMAMATALALSTTAQSLLVAPYLQDAAPDAIRVLFETVGTDAAILEWGPDENLGTEVNSIGTATPEGFLHDILIDGLSPDSPYFYRVAAGAQSTLTYRFRTPPLHTAESDFSFVAMSDMQKSNADPDVFDEIVHQGVIDYFGGETSDEIALVLIPGDLVVNGNNYGQWANDFFAPSHDLFAQVPLYPVLGNHEVNSTYYFQYFHLPENGTAGYEEHWWYKDYGNVRFMGLDSNSPYDGPDQLEWLSEVLAATCGEDHIDFVFAQLHHPHKSELWTPGESDFTGMVVAQLEAIAKKNGFASYDEYNSVVDNISLVLGGFDPQTKKYVGPEAVVKAQIAQVQADKKMAAKDKKDALADLNEALKSPPPAVENKGNIDIVTKSYDKLMEEFGGSDDN